MKEAKAPKALLVFSLSLPLIPEYRLNIISVNAPLCSEENYLSSPQMCWKQQQEPLRAAERRNANAPEQTWLERSWGLNRTQQQRERSWLTDRHAQWRFKTQCHRFVAFLWKPGGILGDTSSLKTPTHHYMLAGSQRSWKLCGVA